VDLHLMVYPTGPGARRKLARFDRMQEIHSTMPAEDHAEFSCWKGDATDWPGWQRLGLPGEEDILSGLVPATFESAVASYIQALQDYENDPSPSSYTTVVEIPKIDIADRILEMLELPTAPRPHSPGPSLRTSASQGFSTGHTVSATMRWRVFKRDNYRCVQCLRDLDLTVDHIHPRSKGGEDSEDNLQTLCRSCNSRKRDRA